MLKLNKSEVSVSNVSRSEKGDIFRKYKNFMGYDCVAGEIVIVPEQAEGNGKAKIQINLSRTEERLTYVAKSTEASVLFAVQGIV